MVFEGRILIIRGRILIILMDFSYDINLGNGRKSIKVQ